MQCAQQERPDREEEESRDRCGGEHLEPPGTAEEVHTQTADEGASGEHQEGELERQQLDDHEHEGEHEPDDPHVLRQIRQHRSAPSAPCLHPNIPGGHGAWL